MIRAITIEREFGCGGSEVAGLVAGKLGWHLWDRELTQEIARLTKSTPQAVEKREWRADARAYQILEDFLRGAFEGGLPPIDRLQLLDARQIAAVSEKAVQSALSSGPSVIVGRGSQYFLRNHHDVFRVFLYASRDCKIRRLIAAGIPQEHAIKQVDTTDEARATFVARNLGLKWPERHLYHAMFNTDAGEAHAASMLLQCLEVIEASESIHGPRPPVPASGQENCWRET